MENMLLTLSLGTNLGDREDNVCKALGFLESEFGDSPVAVTPVMNTKSVGFDAPDFLNMLVQFRCSLPALEVLEICKSIERRMGRNDTLEFDGNGMRIYHDRIIDIDILKYGDYNIDTKTLMLPHPQIFTRDYIKELAAWLPNW